VDYLLTWQTVFEAIATVSGIICVYLQTIEKISAWIFGIISVSLLAIIFLDAQLISDFILHIILLFLNVYGWWQWNRYQENNNCQHLVLRFTSLHWIIWLAIIVIVTPLWGFLISRLFTADLAYFDAFTTVGSLVAQYLLAKKYLENWITWIVVDVIAIGVYTYKELYFVAFLFLIFLVLCIKGYVEWKGRERAKSPLP